MAFKAFKIGEYLIVNRLATGGMAAVYHGIGKTASGLVQHVAIKRLLPNYLTDVEYIKMFEAEARINSQLSHSNIVKTYDFQELNGNYFLTMEYLKGLTLKSFFAKMAENGTQIPIPTAVFILCEILKGLQYAHTKKDSETGTPLNIIHRDINPQNIMLTYGGDVKIIDFGIAKSCSSSDDTKAGILKGKYCYLSPEQIKEQKYDSRVDIFCAGIILYELVTGKRLFKSETDLNTLLMIANCEIPRPRELNPSIPEELERIILKALSANPQDRYQSAKAMFFALQEFSLAHSQPFNNIDLSILLGYVFKKEIQSENNKFANDYKKALSDNQADIELEDKMIDVEYKDRDKTRFIQMRPDWEKGVMYGALLIAFLLLSYAFTPAISKLTKTVTDNDVDSISIAAKDSSKKMLVSW